MPPVRTEAIDIPFAASTVGRAASHLPPPGALILSLALLALALAVGYHARAVRYEVRPLTGSWFVRVDRQTGAMLLCGHPTTAPARVSECSRVSDHPALP